MNRKLLCALVSAALLPALSSCCCCMQQAIPPTTPDTTIAEQLQTDPISTEPPITASIESNRPVFPPDAVWESHIGEARAEDIQGNPVSVKLNFGSYTDTECSVSAVEYNEQVVKLVIPAQHEGMTVVTIENNAFSNFPNLREVVLPSTVRSLSEDAFSENVTKLTCSADLPLTETLLWNVKVLVLNDGCISAGQYCRMAHLTSLTITEGVSGMGVGAFEGCRSLKDVWIEGVPTIPYQAFSYCTVLDSIVLGDGVKKIESEAFSHCGDVQSLSLGKDFCEMSLYCFGWTSVSSIAVSELNTQITARDIEFILWGK